MANIITDFTDFGNRKWKDKLSGGKADDKKPEDFDPDDIAIGTAVQREHTNNPDIATEISMDHLEEDPEYYNKLIGSGIADEEDAIDLYKKYKDENDIEKAKKDILKNMNIDKDHDFNDFEEKDIEEDDDDDFDFDMDDDYDIEGDLNKDEDYDDEDDKDDYDEDDLVGDKVIQKDSELIIDDDEDEDIKENASSSLKILKTFRQYNKKK